MSELAFMQQVWDEWERSEWTVECLECGIQLQFHPYHVAHVISKGSRGDLRLKIENVIPLCVNCHNQFDSVSRSAMMIWYYVKELIFHLKNKYQ